MLKMHEYGIWRITNTFLAKILTKGIEGFRKINWQHFKAPHFMYYSNSCNNDQKLYTLVLKGKISAFFCTTIGTQYGNMRQGLEENVLPLNSALAFSSGRSDTKSWPLPFKCRGKKPCCSNLHLRLQRCINLENFLDKVIQLQGKTPDEMLSKC